MNKTIRTVVIVIVILTLAGGAFFVGSRIMRMRAAMSGAGNVSGGLVAVSAGGQPIAVDSNNPLPENTAAQKADDLNITLALSPYPPVGFQNGSFDVTLTDGQGQAITNATITLDLTMPAMPMPQNTVVAQHTSDGLYHGTGRFTMRGLWRIEVIIERGDQKQSVFFDVNL
jgi:hypothetical protein